MTTDEVSQTLKTNRHARAALGIAASHIREGYDVIESIKPTALDEFIEPRGLLAAALGVDPEGEYAEVRAQGRDLLDRTNAYAGGVYAVIHDDDQALSEAMRGRVAIALEQASSGLQLLESVKENLVQTFVDELAELVTAILSATKDAAEFVAEAAKKIAASVLPPWLLWALGGLGLAAAGYFAWKVTR